MRATQRTGEWWRKEFVLRKKDTTREPFYSRQFTRVFTVLSCERAFTIMIYYYRLVRVKLVGIEAVHVRASLAQHPTRGYVPPARNPRTERGYVPPAHQPHTPDWRLRTSSAQHPTGGYLPPESSSLQRAKSKPKTCGSGCAMCGVCPMSRVRRARQHDSPVRIPSFRRDLSGHVQDHGRRTASPRYDLE